MTSVTLLLASWVLNLYSTGVYLSKILGVTPHFGRKIVVKTDECMGFHNFRCHSHSTPTPLTYLCLTWPHYGLPRPSLLFLYLAVKPCLILSYIDLTALSNVHYCIAYL